MPLARPSSLSCAEQCRRRQRLAVDRDRIAAFEIDRRYRSALSGAFSGIDRCANRRSPAPPAPDPPAPCPRRRRAADWRRPRTALRRACPWRSESGAARRSRCSCLARGEVPFAPWRDHLDVGLERVIGELEPDLVVALAGGAMGDRVGADFLGDLDLLFGDQRPGDRGAEQVLALIQRVGAEHRKHVVADEFLAQILDENVLRLDAEQQRLLARRLKLLALAEIGGEGNDLAAIGGLQPLQDDRRVEPARIGEHDLFHVFRAVFAHGGS